MPRFEKGGQVYETSVPVEIVQLRTSGWKESKARTAEVKAVDQEQAGEPAPTKQSGKKSD